MISQLFFAWSLILASAFASAETTSCPSFCLGQGVDSRTTGNATGIWPWQKFVSVDYHPPTMEIDATGAKLAPGYVFISPANFNTSIPSVKQTAPVIMTDTGELVWNGPSINATNFRMQTLNNKPVITYWGGYSTAGAFIGHGYGNITILDQTYKQIASVCPSITLTHAPPGTYACSLDLHESKITSRNTMLVTAYNVTEADLSAVGGPKNGYIYDCLFFEVALDGSQKILFQWSAFDHVPVTATKQPIATTGLNATDPFDYFHINSVDLVGGKYLVNSRHTWSTFLVHPSGKIAWTLEGQTGGDFGAPPPHGKFAWQHDARAHDVSDKSIIISFFNNYDTAVPGINGTNPPTDLIALRLSLPPNAKETPRLLNHVTNNPPIYSESQGSYDFNLAASDGHQFAGYGQIPLVREYSSKAKGSSGLLWSARFGFDNLVQSFRGFKMAWDATPTTKPTLVVKHGDKASCRSGYVSWNGATAVTSYNVYEGASKGNLCKAGSVKRAGFETMFGVSQACVQVGAVKGKKEVSRSEVICSA